MNWFYRLWKRMQLLRTRDLTFKMEMECENTVSSTALEINSHLAGVLPTLRALRVRLAQLRTRIAETLFTTDPWGNKEPLAQPAFTPDQVRGLRAKARILPVAIAAFVVAEVALYYLISTSLVGGIPGLLGHVALWGLSLVFALFVLFGFGHGWDKLLDYIDARELFAVKRITRQAYNGAVTKLVSGGVLFLGALGFLTYAGTARINLIEKASLAANSKLDAGLRDILIKGSEDSGIMAMIFCYGVAMLLAYLKHDLRKAQGRYAAYKAWAGNTREQERIVEEIARIQAKVKGYAQQRLEVGVQLCHDLQRIYGVQYDPAHKELFGTYVQERAKPGFIVTRDILNKYRPVIVADEQLFTAAVMEKVSVKVLLEALNEEAPPHATSLDFLYKGLTKDPGLRPVPGPTAPSANGSADLDKEIKALLQP